MGKSGFLWYQGGSRTMLAVPLDMDDVTLSRGVREEESRGKPHALPPDTCVF